ncbi:hypothetical protein D6C00_02745 [Thiohalobacter thiocyanaticus]|uniref:PilZ domain-containing protein n=1 Tax=Thiohalobacter thiocyanaticus TaxID=585455 RepID=A0A426QGX6_9GAMM|nr:hypothetical protein D6C00_02745 [Thiohalobacter thiocyanaticus]
MSCQRVSVCKILFIREDLYSWRKVLMEHRSGVRQDVNLNVKVYLESLPPLLAVSRDISKRGMNLPLTHPALDPMRVVSVSVCDVNGEQCLETKAMVIHATENGGTGLLLGDDMPTRFLDMRECLAEQTSKAY